MSGDIPRYSEVSIELRNSHNNSKSDILLKGKYIGNEFPGQNFNNRIYKFSVNTDDTGQAMIGTNHLVCLPCPDFCSGGISIEDAVKEEEALIKKKVK